MGTNFNKSLEYTFGWEGGYTNHPADPGGPTNWGITIFDYRRYIDPAGSAADVKKMKKEQAAQIYKEKYWDLQHCDKMPGGLDFAMFDYGVNSGIGRSQKALQKILKVEPDGIIGQKTLTAMRLQDTQYMIRALCAERLRFLRGLKTWPVFGAGWKRRVEGVEQQAISILRGSPL